MPLGYHAWYADRMMILTLIALLAGSAAGEVRIVKDQIQAVSPAGRLLHSTTLFPSEAETPKLIRRIVRSPDQRYTGVETTFHMSSATTGGPAAMLVEFQMFDPSGACLSKARGFPRYPNNPLTEFHYKILNATEDVTGSIIGNDLKHRFFHLGEDGTIFTGQRGWGLVEVYSSSWSLRTYGWAAEKPPVKHPIDVARLPLTTRGRLSADGSTFGFSRAWRPVGPQDKWRSELILATTVPAPVWHQAVRGVEWDWPSPSPDGRFLACIARHPPDGRSALGGTWMLEMWDRVGMKIWEAALEVPAGGRAAGPRFSAKGARVEVLLVSGATSRLAVYETVNGALVSYGPSKLRGITWKADWDGGP